MHHQSHILGIIFVNNVDRRGNDRVLRGTLDFFGKSIVQIISEEVLISKINKTVVYTISKGNYLKSILNNNIKYIIKSGESWENSNTFLIDMSSYLEKYQHIFLIDAKYPFLDANLINSVIDFHFKEHNNCTYIKSDYKNKTYIPKIGIMDKESFIHVFDDFHIKSKHPEAIDMIEEAVRLGYRVAPLVVSSPFKILEVTTDNKIKALENTLLYKK